MIHGSYEHCAQIPFIVLMENHGTHQKKKKKKNKEKTLNIENYAWVFRGVKEVANEN